ncbi:heavy-metal-associated domain-containing protein [Microbacterium gorillae]|uniref:heavy-metal-associated domain-containing protein n=1 Tax=Microbacterium gorillae TaxID=1231063 RepID=UPI00059009CF|nr:heavy-metal-associated domain-containing protein [Microbacterium gorillae]
MSTETYRVEGMTCGHCAQAVTSEVSGVTGVTAAVVDLEANTVAVTADIQPAPDAIAAAVEEAGYTLTGRA